MPLTGWIVYNGNLPGGKFLDFAEWLQQSATQKGINTKIYQNHELLVSLGNRTQFLSDQKPLPHFVLFIDKDIYLARQFELLGVRVFNSAKAIEISDDKIATYQTLAENQLPIPRTVVAPKIFSGAAAPVHGDVDAIIDQLNLPMIIKEAYGSFGEQVYLIHTRQELMDKVNKIVGRPFVFQEFVNTSFGKDMRLHVVGDTVVAAMTRYTANDFRANVTAGGAMQAYHPSDQEKQLAIAATKSIGADFAGVDLLFGADDTRIICEINSNAHIRNMYNCTGVNVADYMIDYVEKAITTNGEKTR